MHKILKKNNIPEDVELMSDSGWECYATKMNIELLPFQKEILKQTTIDRKRLYICYPPNFGRTDLRTPYLLVSTLFEKENKNA